jgi:hypothetical protein
MGAVGLEFFSSPVFGLNRRLPELSKILKRPEKENIHQHSSSSFVLSLPLDKAKQSY